MGVLICELGEEILTQIIRLLLAFQVIAHVSSIQIEKCDIKLDNQTSKILFFIKRKIKGSKPTSLSNDNPISSFDHKMRIWLL